MLKYSGFRGCVIVYVAYGEFYTATLYRVARYIYRVKFRLSPVSTAGSGIGLAFVRFSPAI